MATRCPASSLLGDSLVWALDALTPLIRHLGRMHEMLFSPYQSLRYEPEECGVHNGTEIENRRGDGNKS
jgi:hypothetical protein